MSCSSRKQTPPGLASFAFAVRHALSRRFMRPIYARRWLGTSCYAFELHDKRYKVYIENNGLWPETGLPMPKQYAKPFSEIQLFPHRLEQPLRMKQPKRIFVDSMSDLFHSNVPDSYILQVFDVM